MKYLGLIGLLFLFGCAGSPRVVVNKNIEVHIEGVIAHPSNLPNPYYPFPVYIEIKYTTKSDIPIDADVKQSAEDAFKASLPTIP